ncbi:GGDEF domain-containing protein [Mangrovitalea sediminis]|uniref:GGDEF domain-containing protein n=1 Tax=Mangrovitalea sediminis TaxID=1982043 RepID=UPI000BE4C5F7|nr:GAF domain-containing protein [Mangrovitalea sediminis]
MQPPVVPINEQLRLASLRATKLLDTPVEERFDRITRLAQRFFSVPIAAFTLIDARRQWFKSAQGMPLVETGRDLSFCGHVILQPGLLIVPDTLQDVRFADNPLVAGDPKIRFYAGVPVLAPDGQAVGALCIMDREPRNFTVEDLAFLKDLGAMIEQEIELPQLTPAQWALIEEQQEGGDLIDPETRLWNRGGILRLIDRMLEMGKREEIPFSVMLVRADPVRDDGQGLDSGTLQVVAHRLMSALRSVDAIGRYDASTFLCLLATDEREQVTRIGERIRSRIASESLRGQIPQGVSVSVGGVLPAGRPPAAGVLLNAAERALSTAQVAGRNCLALAEAGSDKVQIIR